MRRTYTTDEARGIAESLGIDFASSGFDLEQFHAGLNVEAEHGGVDPATNVTDDDPLTTGKIALAHLNELPDYYTRLKEMEASAEQSATAESTPIAETGSGSRQRSLKKALPVGLALLISGALFARFFRRRRASDGSSSS